MSNTQLASELSAIMKGILQPETVSPAGSSQKKTEKERADKAEKDKGIKFTKPSQIFTVRKKVNLREEIRKRIFDLRSFVLDYRSSFV